MRVRKWLSLLVALAMVVSMLVISVSADPPPSHNVPGNGTLASKTVTFTVRENTTIGRKVDASGNVSYNYDIHYGNSYGIFNPVAYPYAVRPIVTLKSGLTPSSGNGTISSHYTFS